MSTRAQVLTPWAGSGTDDDSYRAAFTDDYACVSCTDVTAQPSTNLRPAPNLLVVEVVVDDSLWPAIAADPRYPLIWSEAVV